MSFRRSRGFTLIEILVVIAVISILSAVVSPMVFRNVGDAKVSAAKAQVDIFGLALQSYRLDNDRYPTSEQGLAALAAMPIAEPLPRNWRGPYLSRGVPLDPWGNAYIYTFTATETSESFEVVSLGRDGRPGGSGEDADVSSAGPAH